MSESRRFTHRIASMGDFAVGLLAFVVVTAFAGVSDLDAGHDAQDPVDLAVAGARQPVSDLVSGGGVDGGGAVPGREVGLVWESGDVADLDHKPGGS
jgi:hypothetical protein